jgi:hypothetical protein
MGCGFYRFPWATILAGGSPPCETMPLPSLLPRSAISFVAAAVLGFS